MAFADDLAGPWTLKSGGVLSLVASTLLTKPPKKPIDYQENKTQKKGLDAGYNPPKEYEARIPILVGSALGSAVQTRPFRKAPAEG